MAQKLTWQIVDEIAASLDVSYETRRKWRQSGRGVPQAWRIKIAEVLMQRGHAVNFSEFDALPENPGVLAA